MKNKRGFSLVEMLVSIAVFSILMLILTQIIASISSVVARTSQGLQQFRSGRNAFETITRRLSQATLNSYDGLSPTSGSTYVPISELRFTCGNATNLLMGSSISNLTHPTDAVFFQAPLGFTTNSTYSNLPKLLNTCGYYIEWNSDASSRPAFLPAAVPARWRFRLMELIEPAESLSIYKYTSGPSSSNPAYSQSWYYTTTEWFQNPLSESPIPTHAIADNVIFLAILPMVAPANAQHPPGGDIDGTSTDLSPDYNYDSSPKTGNANVNALPPMVYVEMICVDETSFSRYETTLNPTNSYPSGIVPLSILASSSYASRSSDVSTVIANLNSYHIGYHIFTAAVTISGS